MVASGAGWESRALELLAGTPDVVVLKRCVDVDDLLATASTGQSDVAVVALDAPGLDSAAVGYLHRHRVRVVAVVANDGAGAVDAARMRAARWDITALVAEADLGLLAGVVTAADAPQASEPRDHPDGAGHPHPAGGQEVEPSRAGRIVTVWGPRGAPGVTTVAVTFAAVLAARGLTTLLVDADPYGGAVAQQLGVLDEASGLLAAARLAASGDLEERFATVQRSLGGGLALVTGLPRPDRWAEVRAGAVEHLLEVARERGQVVVDTGFSLEQDPGGDFGSRPPRNSMTIGALQVADEILVVGSADPIGLSRLARGLVELRDVAAETPTRVLVNRYRPTLGWSEADIVGMVEGFARVRGVHFLPEDQAAVDRALVAGRTLLESDDSALSRVVAEVVDVVHPDSVVATPGRRRVRRRTAGTARRR
jgi:MinD-like ATPase involved in chromosome partitioning or flagellar assembly